ncbi:hypothetical protein S7711_09683 [Stachybotrys chartarum IBT 7711]|uniref:Alpha-1,3-mannosyltransferase CMT1 n=1 Tax=Stachybotrys chartarum (strain CBS 109288 / IBT 7711) TaxID=1280523 RepID=A0A084AXD4_STACB|nr:hypothetical protein S7711_09683 [Stachybotrys chartarum IBT 7711]
MRRKLLQLLATLLCLQLILTSLCLLYFDYLHIEDLSSILRLSPQHESAASSSAQHGVASPVPTSSAALASSSEAVQAPTATLKPTATSPAAMPDGAILSVAQISLYIAAILDPAATELPRLECPTLDSSRYTPLLEGQDDTSQRIDYYFALDLRNCLAVLPRLLGSIIEAIRLLGPHRCALSVVEGHSPDGTADVLAALIPQLESIGISYFFNSSDIDPAAGDRIQKLAKLRNLTLQPLLDHRDRASKNTTIIFINDVAACTEDLLELALQRRNLGADMTCAMDWTYVGPDPTFYDVWVARTIYGDSFFDIPPDGNWNSAWNLFWNAPETQGRYRSLLPFQVFSCWNGAAAFGATLILNGLRFRHPRGGEKGECAQGEPQLFCKDLWYHGHGKVAVIPTVNLENSDKAGDRIKRLKGYTSALAKSQVDNSNKIDWILNPPEQVKCMGTWDSQFWRPWNETLDEE